MSSKLKRAVISTLIYSDIFNYPLKLTEIKHFLIGYRLPIKNWQMNISKIIKSISQVSEKKGYYFLSRRKKIISERVKKNILSQKKISYAEKIARLLFYIPTVKLIAVTGNLALMAADKNDDIDL